MAHEIRRAVVYQISKRNRVSLAVASHIYGCKSIKQKQAMCEQELRRQMNLNKRDVKT